MTAAHSAIIFSNSAVSLVPFCMCRAISSANLILVLLFWFWLSTKDEGVCSLDSLLDLLLLVLLLLVLLLLVLLFFLLLLLVLFKGDLVALNGVRSNEFSKNDLELNWNVLEHSGTFWNILEPSGNFWKLLELDWNTPGVDSSSEASSIDMPNVESSFCSSNKAAADDDWLRGR